MTHLYQVMARQGVLVSSSYNDGLWWQDEFNGIDLSLQGWISNQTITTKDERISNCIMWMQANTQLFIIDTIV